MPMQFQPVIAAGSLCRSAQPSIPVGAGAVLRPWEAKDAAALASAYNDPEILRWHSRRADSAAETRQWIDRWRADWDTESGCHWVIADSNTVAVLGRMSLDGLDFEDGIANLAYWIVREQRGRGLCTKSMLALCRWAFAEAGFHRIQIEHSIHNLPSCRVATKGGFPGEGVRRQAAQHADGWHDMHVHARLKSDSRTAGSKMLLAD